MGLIQSVEGLNRMEKTDSPLNKRGNEVQRFRDDHGESVCLISSDVYEATSQKHKPET